MGTRVLNIKNTEISFRILELDTDTNVGKVVVKIDGRQKTFNNVLCSNLLSWSVANDKVMIGKEYKSTICSEDYKSNPIQMIKYTGTDEEDKQVDKFMFTMVSERTPLVEIDVCPITGNEIRTYTNRYHKKSYYKRYRCYTKKNSTTTNIG